MSDHPPLVNMEALSKNGHYRNRVGNCRSDREPWPCQRWLDAEKINDLDGMLHDAFSKVEGLLARLEAIKVDAQLDRELWNDLAELVRDDIIEDDVALEALVYDAVKRVLSEREDARRWAVRLEQRLAS